MNEGWATFWHYTLLNELYDRGLVTEGFILEFLQSHAGVIPQPPVDHPGCSGLNPYTPGTSTMQAIRRSSENPTDADRHWTPDTTASARPRTLKAPPRHATDD